MENKKNRDIRRAATVLDTAEVMELSQSQVQKVLRTERNNDLVVAVFMEITERKKILLDDMREKTLLMKAVEAIAPSL